MQKRIPAATAAVIAVASFGAVTASPALAAPARPVKPAVGRSFDTANSSVVVSSIAVNPQSPARRTITVTPAIVADAAIKAVKMTITTPSGRTVTISAIQAPWTMTWSSAGNDGDATIAVYATDVNGVTGSNTTTVTLDNTAPSGAVNLGTYVGGITPVALTDPSPDTAKMDVYVRGALIGEATSAPWSVSLDTTKYTGTIPIKVVTYDQAGNRALGGRRVIVNNEGPKLTWNTPAVMAKTVLRGTITISASAADPAGIASVELLDATGTVINSTTTFPYAFPLDTTTIAGSTTVTLRATDTLGLVSTVTKQLVVDNEAPVIGDVSTGADNPGRGAITIAPDVSDNTAVQSVKAVLTLADGRTVNLAAASAPWSMKWLSSQAGANGPVSATITATDTAGNATTVVKSFDVDNIAPSAAATLPLIADGVVPITLTAPSDDTVTMDVMVKGKSVGQATGAPWTVNWDTTGLNGPTAVTIRTVDAAGNVSLLNKSITIDNTGPQITVLSPNKVTGLAQVKLGVSDPSGVASVSLMRDGQVIASSTTAPFTLAVDTTGFDKGSDTWTIQATDTLGNVSTLTKVFAIS
jgi:hypothetical protein